MHSCTRACTHTQVSVGAGGGAPYTYDPMTGFVDDLRFFELALDATAIMGVIAQVTHFGAL